MASRPNVRQIFLTVVWLMPALAAMLARTPVGSCLLGLASKVATTIPSRPVPSEIARGRPQRPGLIVKPGRDRRSDDQPPTPEANGPASDVLHLPPSTGCDMSPAFVAPPRAGQNDAGAKRAGDDSCVLVARAAPTPRCSSLEKGRVPAFATAAGGHGPWTRKHRRIFKSSCFQGTSPLESWFVPEARSSVSCRGARGCPVCGGGGPVLNSDVVPRGGGGALRSGDSGFGGDRARTPTLEHEYPPTAAENGTPPRSLVAKGRAARLLEGITLPGD